MKRIQFVMAALLIACLALPAVATELYTWTDENGNIVITDKKPDEREDMVKAAQQREAAARAQLQREIIQKRQERLPRPTVPQCA